MSNNAAVASILNGMNYSLWYLRNYWVLLNGLLDTGIQNDLIWFGLMSKCSINSPKNKATFKMSIYKVLSSCATAVADLTTVTLVIASHEWLNPFTTHSWTVVDNILQFLSEQQVPTLLYISPPPNRTELVVCCTRWLVFVWLGHPLKTMRDWCHCLKFSSLHLWLVGIAWVWDKG